jgi:hypothetical protein
MSPAGTFIHRHLLIPEHLTDIKTITGWSVDGRWDVSSRRWWNSLTLYNQKYQDKGTGENLVTVFHYGKRAVVFIDDEPVSFTSKFKASDFGGPSTLGTRSKYEFFEEHRDHKNHCHTCHPKR